MYASPTPVGQFAAFEIADTLINSGVYGANLAKLLADRFPTARRFEVFLGAALAMTHALSMILEAEIELQSHRQGTLQ